MRRYSSHLVLLTALGCLSPSAATVTLEAPATLAVGSKLMVESSAFSGGFSSCWSESYETRTLRATSANPSLVRVEVLDGRAFVIGVAPGRTRVDFEIEVVGAPPSKKPISVEIEVLALDELQLTVEGRTACPTNAKLLTGGEYILASSAASGGRPVEIELTQVLNPSAPWWRFSRDAERPEMLYLSSASPLEVELQFAKEQVDRVLSFEALDVLLSAEVARNAAGSYDVRVRAAAGGHEVCLPRERDLPLTLRSLTPAVCTTSAGLASSEEPAVPVQGMRGELRAVERVSKGVCRAELALGGLSATVIRFPMAQK